MEISQIIPKVLHILKENLENYIEYIFKEIYGEKYIFYLNNSIESEQKDKMIDYFDTENYYRNKYKDISYFINLFLKYWEGIFKIRLNNNYILSLLHSIRYYRNRWAHQSDFTVREIYRLIDESQALL